MRQKNIHLSVVTYLVIAVLCLTAFLGNVHPARAQSAALRADALVMVNSASATYSDFAAWVQPYLDQFGVFGEVTVGPGAWNTGWNDGRDFVQWAGTQAQKNALTRVGEISQAVQAALRNATHIGSRNPELLNLLEEAHWRVLRAETSCHFFWGESWVSRAHAGLDDTQHWLDLARAAP